MRLRRALAAALVIPFLAGSAWGLPFEEAVSLLVDGNKRYSEGRFLRPNVGKARVAAMAGVAQRPFATVLACSDSQVPVEVLFDRGIGDLYVVRVAGNVAGADEVASVEYGAGQLGTSIVVVLGHTACDAVAAAAAGGSELGGSMSELLAFVTPAVTRARETNPGLAGDALVNAAVTENVWQAVEDLMVASSIVRERLTSGSLQILGALYSTETGRVTVLGPHPREAEILGSAGGTRAADAVSGASQAGAEAGAGEGTAQSTEASADAGTAATEAAGGSAAEAGASAEEAASATEVAGGAAGSPWWPYVLAGVVVAGGAAALVVVRARARGRRGGERGVAAGVASAGLSLSSTLVGSFLCVAAIGVVIGVVGLVGLATVSSDLREIAGLRMVGLNALRIMNETQLTADSREKTLLSVDMKAAERAAIFEGFDASRKRGEDAWRVYNPLPKTAEEASIWKEYVEAYDAWLKDHDALVAMAREYGALRDGGRSAAQTWTQYNRLSELILERASASAARTEELIGKLVDVNYGVASTLSASAERAAVRAKVVTILAVALGFVLATLVGLLVSGRISRPIGAVAAGGARLARGELPERLPASRSIREVGDLTDMLNGLIDALRKKGEEAARIASGDLATEVHFASEKDALASSFDEMTRSLNQLLGQVTTAVEQVNSGSEQVAAASQALSQGATEQASSLEEISSSLTEIAGQTKRNAGNAAQANALARQAQESAVKGNAQMAELVAAMKGISESSDRIRKVIKVIDDMAFQINLLALNANVEAAHAGKYGKGFAVVADEVRTLAVRSAQSVRETTDMVEASLKSIARGNVLVSETAKQLEDITVSARRSAELVEEIAVASREQSSALDQVSSGLTQVDQVTQANTASAEQSASAAEQLLSQAAELKGLIGSFRLKDQSGEAAAAGRVSRRLPPP
jgi:methyl-accepting chemotaxis protein